MLGTCVASGGLQPRVTREIKPRVSIFLHTLKQLTLYLTHYPYNKTHLDTGLLNAEIHANLARNKANKMVNQILPYNLPLWLFRYKTLKQTLDLTCELGTVEQNSLTPNSRSCEALES